MKKSKGKDISFHSDLQISYVESRLSKSKYFDILIVFLGVIGATYFFISSFDLEYNKIVIPCAITCSVLLFSYIFNLDKLLKYTLAIVSVVCVIAVGIFYEAASNGFMTVWDIVSKVINNNLNLDIFHYNNIYLGGNEGSITIFLVFTIFIISGLISFSILYKPNSILLLIITMPILVIALFCGRKPYYFSFELLVLTWISVIGMRTLKNKSITNKSMNQFQKERNKYYFVVRGENRNITTNIGIILAIITMTIFIITSIICPPSSYKPTYKMEELQESYVDFLNGFTYERFTNNLMGIGQGGVNGGELGTIGRVKYKNETALEVKAPWNGNDIYLKGFTGCEYTGNRWEDISDEENKEINYGYYEYDSVDGFKINSVMTSMLNFSRNENTIENYVSNISIKNLNANKDYVYIPYNSFNYRVGGNTGIVQNKETSLSFSDGKSEYEFDYYPNLVNLQNLDRAKCEIEYQIRSNSHKIPSSNNNLYIIKNTEKYTDFVNDTYTRLPNISGLHEIKNKYSGRYEETKDIKTCVNEAISAVNDGITYDLAPGKLPEGKDYVEYFLYENKKGYCSHFASAATVILRAMGVPARYAEGYVVKKSDADKATSITTGRMEREKNSFLTKSIAIKEMGITEEEFINRSIEDYVFSGGMESVQCEFMTMDIKDTNAHAWVEVYVDNIGWIPIDVTPGFGDNGKSVESIGKVDVVKSNEGDTTLVYNKDKNNGQAKITEEKVTDNNVSEETVIDNSESMQSANYSILSILKVIIILVGILFVIIGTLILRNRIIITNRKKSFTNEDDNKNVHNIYKYLMGIFKYAGVENKENLPACEYAKIVQKRYSFVEVSEFIDLINIIFKADFSEHKISKEELDKVIKFTNKLNEETYNKLSGIQKIKYTYFKNLR